MTTNTRDRKANIRFFVAGADEPVRTPTADTNRCEFNFANGAKLEFALDEFPANIRAIATWRGLAEKIRDAYAGSKTSDEAEDTAGAIIEMLRAGAWTEGREGGPGVRVLDFAQAYKETTKDKRTVEELAEVLRTDEAKFKAVRSHPTVANRADQIATARRAEKRSAKGADAAVPTI